MRRTQASGWIGQNSSMITMRALCRTVVPLGIGLVMMSGAARAADDDRPFTEKLMDSFYGTIRGTSMDNRGIDYRERSPLVVPPTLDLPPPSAAKADGQIANWPKDPDERQRKAVIAAKKKTAPPPGRVLVSSDGSVAPQPINIAPPVEPTPVPGTTRPEATSIMSRQATDPIYDKPGDLLTGGAAVLSGWGDSVGLGGLFGKSNPVPVQPGTEPVREALTQPPVGYQVPSANYEYGPEKRGLFDGQSNPDRNPASQKSSASSVVR